MGTCECWPFQWQISVVLSQVMLTLKRDQVSAADDHCAPRDLVLSSPLLRALLNKGACANLATPPSDKCLSSLWLTSAPIRHQAWLTGRGRPVNSRVLPHIHAYMHTCTFSGTCVSPLSSWGPSLLCPQFTSPPLKLPYHRNHIWQLSQSTQQNTVEAQLKAYYEAVLNSEQDVSPGG